MATNADAGTARTEGTSRTWRAGGGQRIILSFLLLILLPFYASLGPMLYQRASRGLWLDTLSLGMLALFFTALMGLILWQLLHAVRSRIDLSADAMSFTLPTVGKRGPMPTLTHRSAKIAYADIAAIETRSEVYGGTLAPVMLTSTRIALKDGTRHVLGYSNEHEIDESFPFKEIGKTVAASAGVPLTDNGTVRRSLQQRLAGTAATAEQNAPLTKDDVAAINGAHTRNVRLLVAGLALLLVGGITLDFATASRAAYAEMGAGLSNPAKGTPQGTGTPKKK